MRTIAHTEPDLGGRGGSRRGVALIMVMLVVSTLMIIGVLFSGSVTAEYRASVYYRQAVQSEQYCIVGMHRAMAELMYDVWGVNQARPFESARYNPVVKPARPDLNLLPLADAAYYEVDDGDSAGAVVPILRQRGFWNGEGWVVWADGKGGLGTSDATAWQKMSPIQNFYGERPGGSQRYLSAGAGPYGTVEVQAGNKVITGGVGSVFLAEWKGHDIHIGGCGDTIGVISVTKGSPIVTRKPVPGNPPFDPSWGSQFMDVIAGGQNPIALTIATVNSADQLTLSAAAPITDSSLSYSVAATSGYRYAVSAVSPTASPPTITLDAAWKGYSTAGLRFYLPNFPNTRPSADATFTGGGQSVAAFNLTNVGPAPELGWVDPGKYVMTLPSTASTAWQLGGIDLTGDGSVDEEDKALRDWALWQLKRDAFLPEAMDNNDMFQAALHANNRDLFPPGVTAGDRTGYEMIDARLVGDSFYQIFRFDPIYSVAKEPGYDGYKPLDGADRLDGIGADKAGYRYPYDRSHIGLNWKVLASDPLGGLVNINGSNNDYNIEQWPRSAPAGAPNDTPWQHICEAKWIDCYDPLRSDLRAGRYAVTVLPDCGVWNANAMHSGKATYISGDTKVDTEDDYIAYGTAGVGDVAAVSGYFYALSKGFKPDSGTIGVASFLQSNWFTTAPIRPGTLPAHWVNGIGKTSLPRFRAYNSATGPNGYKVAQTTATPPVDWTRAPHKDLGADGLGLWAGNTTTVRTSIFNYLIWLGPYDSRTEFATHMRKGCLLFNTVEPTTDVNTWMGEHVDSLITDEMIAAAPEDQREILRSLRKTARDKVKSDATMLSYNTTVQGYYYTLDRFWDRDMLVIEDGFGTAGGDDPRFATADCARALIAVDADGSSRIDGDEGCGGVTRGPASDTGNARATRWRHFQYMNDLECFGGFRTPDGNYRLFDYIFDDAAADYDPATAPVGEQKMMAVTTARLCDYQRVSIERAGGASAVNGVPRTAACARGHVLHNPWLSTHLKLVGTETQRRTAPDDPTFDEIGMGCPVCGGKLFLAPVDNMGINEIGRFYERFRTAERPSRVGFDMAAAGGNKDARPARHFIELVACHRSLADTRDLLRFDRLGGWSGTQLTSFSGTLSDPATGSPYFTSFYDQDWRWRMESNYQYTDVNDPVTGADEGPIDPEPSFRRVYGGTGDSNIHVMVYDDAAVPPRWYDVTQYVEPSWNYDDKNCGDYAERPVLAGTYWKFVADDADPDSGSWISKDIYAGEKYVIPDPDPAHQQAAEQGVKYWDTSSAIPANYAWVTWTGKAAVSIYRKMPVRWYGGVRHDPYDSQYKTQQCPNPPGDDQLTWPLDQWTEWNAAGKTPGDPNPPPSPPAKPQPDVKLAGRGCLFGSGLDHSSVRLSACPTYLGGGQAWARYKGDYVGPAPADNGGWPGLDKRNSCSTSGENWTAGGNYTHPCQYGVVTFDGRFDGSKVAITKTYVGGSGGSPRYHMILDYVELTDSAGTPIKISTACVPDPNSGAAGAEKTVLSWQARDPQEHRANCDGYMCWDLLPMTLHAWPTGLANPYEGTGERPEFTYGVFAGNPADRNIDATGGYHPWPAWWGNEYDGSAYHNGFPTDDADRPFPGQGMPPGYFDIEARSTNSRNRNMYHRDFPTRRSQFAKTAGDSIDSADARSEHLALDRCNRVMSDGTTGVGGICKEVWISIPTGIGRQVSVGDTKDWATELATYSGRQHDQLAGMVWREGLAAPAATQKWAGYSWDRWSDIFRVTDLCQQYLTYVGSSNEDRDVFDADQDGEWDEMSSDGVWGATPGVRYYDASGAVAAVSGRFIGELKQVNKVNLNEVWYPPVYGGIGWTVSNSTFSRKPLKGFHSPSDMLTYNAPNLSYYNTSIMRWDLDQDVSEDHSSESEGAHYNRLDAIHCASSPVYTFFVTGNALDDAGEPLAEMRTRLTVERTWDGRCNILEFCWMPADRGFME